MRDLNALVRKAVENAYYLASEDAELDFEYLFEGEWDLEDLAALFLIADDYRKTANRVHRLIGDYLEPLLENRSVDVNGTLVWRGESKRERCIDPEAFWSWLSTHEDPEMVRKVFNPDYARKSPIPPAARDTFFEKQPTGKVEVQQAPVEVLEQARRKKESQGG